MFRNIFISGLFVLSVVVFPLHATEVDGERPNILVVIADDMGHAAYTPNAECSSSRSSILTGRNPWQNGDAGNSIGSTGKILGPGMLPPERENFTGGKIQSAAVERSTLLLGRERNDTLARAGELMYLHNFAPDRGSCEQLKEQKDLECLEKETSLTNTL